MSNGVNFRTLCIDLRVQLDRVTAERDAALGREAALREELDEAQRVLGFSGNEADAYSTAALHDELDDCIRLSNNRELARKNSDLLVEAQQQRLTAADERADELIAALTRAKMWVGQYRAWYGDSGVVADDYQSFERTLRGLPNPPTEFDAALKPAEGGGDEAV